MKKITKLFLGLTTAFMAIALATSPLNYEVIEPDNIVYDDPTVASLANPHFASDDEDVDEDVGPVDVVRIHYVNEDGQCKGRAFYVWVNGVDGVEYSNDVDVGKDIVTYSEDGTSMTIEMRVDGTDPRFAPFQGRSSLMYIIKYKMISPSNLNWGGQSDDVELHYSEFPPVNKEVDVWCTPAAGGGMAQFATEAETKVDGIKMGKFTDWKTIQCTATDNCKTVNWSLYAFDENYYRVKAKKREPIKKNFLVKTGSQDVSVNKVFDIEFKYTAKINVVYMLVSRDPNAATDLTKICYVSFEKLYDTARFKTFYTPLEADDLGMTYSTSATTFKVWAPTAANMSLLIYDSNTSAAYGGDDKFTGFHMNYVEGGIWKLTVKVDLKGKYYNLQVDNTLGTSVCMDPYATAAGTSGVRGMVYDKADTNPTDWDKLPLVWDGNTTFKWNASDETEVSGLDITTPQELTVYEVHVGDFTGDSSWVSNKGNENGTYNAFVESGTRLAEDSTVTTGYDHLDELGINTVQLLPVFDADNDESIDPTTGKYKRKYNWGYNPLNYNCVDGVYSSNPTDGTVRIKEYKNLILKLSQTHAHTRVVMDVVYNHVSSPSASCFNKLMPRYYFRYDENGELYDGSGCHNEVKSDAPMMRKFIVESVTMWAREYKIKGFRFDLMGLIDWATMNEIKKACSEIDPDIYLYGEGWTSGGYHGPTDDTGSASTYEVYKYCNNFNKTTGEDDTESCYVGCFNDMGRNSLRGANSAWGGNYPLSGFMQKGEDYGEDPYGVADMVWGIHRGKSNYARQTVNYASCHDNWTLRDQLYNTMNDGAPAGAEALIKAVIVAEAVVFASNACAFMQGGEELYRTKEIPDDILDECLPNTYEEMHGHNISHNSYNSPMEVNSFKWGNKVQVTVDGKTVKNSDLHYNEAFKDMIKLHNEIPKYSLANNKTDNFPSGITSAGNEYINLFWMGSYGCSMGVQLDEYFIYVVGRNQADIPADKTICDNCLFSYGIQNFGESSIHMGNSSYGYAIRVCKRGA